MIREWVPGGALQLLERNREFAEIDAVIRASTAEQGSFLVLEGGPGMGKTALLAEVRGRAAAAGLATYSARGSELEGEFAFGVVRQLFEEAITTLSPEERAGVFKGAAALAEPVLDMGAEPVAGGQFAALHGLYWLAANLSARQPLLLAVDDAHWADASSLRWLAYLLNRLEGLTVLVVMATRPPRAGPEGEFLDAIMAHPDVGVLRLSPLGEASVTALARSALNSEPDPVFTAACVRATAGNPLGLRELLRELRAGGVAPSSEAAREVEKTAPDAITRRVLRDLRLLGHESERLARALAVIGDGTEGRLVSRLAGLEADRAAKVADDLEAAHLVLPARPLRFAHPLIRAAVYDRMAAGIREKLHQKAAELLVSERAHPEAVAAHLLRCDAGGRGWTVEWLRAAAPLALRRGSPEAAISYLERALAEDTDAATRSAVLAELGAAELAAGNPAASGHFREALLGIRDPRAHAATLADLALAVILETDESASLDLLEKALDELRDCDPAASARLECIVLGLSSASAQVASSLEGGYSRLRELAPAGTPDAELARATLAFLLSWRDGNREEALPYVGRGFDWKVLLEGPYLQPFGILWGVLALLGIDELPRAASWCETVIRQASAQGYPLIVVTGMVFKAYAECRMGLLAEAEADATAALDMSQEQFPYWTPLARAYLAEILFERGRQEASYATIEDVGEDVSGTLRGAAVREIRGRLRCARGWGDLGVDDLRASGRLCDALQLHNPMIWPWRVSLATEVALDSPDEARQLAQENLTGARRSGIPRAIGVALRTLAALEPDHAIDLLREAIVSLGEPPAPLDRARAMADLGAALRRRGHRVEAREPLREALEIAARCGAVPLTERIQAEALAAGARPRRPRLRGVDALTPSELRVARLAAEGRSNREIAQALFVTMKTVADHLGNTYSKLDVRSRDQLTGALGLSNI